MAEGLHIAATDLTAVERESIEFAIGVGLTETGGPILASDPITTGCHKLGLVPIGWHNEERIPRPE